MNLFETKLIEFTFYKFHFRVHDINVQFLEKKSYPIALIINVMQNLYKTGSIRGSMFLHIDI